MALGQEAWEDMGPKELWEAEGRARKQQRALVLKVPKRKTHYTVWYFYKLDGSQGGWRCSSWFTVDRHTC